MRRIVYLERDALRVRVGRPTFDHEWQEYGNSAPAEVFERIKDADIVIVNKVLLDGELLARLPRLQLIAVAATGTDNVDLAWCRHHGLPVVNVRGYAVHAVPEHVMMMILALRRQLIAYRADLAAGQWQRAEQFCYFGRQLRDIAGSTIGLIGRGVLGEGVAHLAAAFGMRVLWGERKDAAVVRPGYVSFRDLLGAVDVLSLHCPLSEQTRGMIGAEELAAMKRDALLINTARGALVDEQALLAALRSGIIAGAGVDVLSQEPPRNGNPLLDADLPNLIVTPHVAWASSEAMQALADQVIANLEAFVRGEAHNRVT